MHCNAATWNFITSGKSHARTGIGGPSKQQRVVLRRRKTVVGGKSECTFVLYGVNRPCMCCHSETGEILSQMGAGDFFGEIGILNLDGGVNR